MQRIIVILLLLINGSNFSFGQTKGFKKYSDINHHFSFDMPIMWNIIADTDTVDSEIISVCRPLTKEELEEYTDCYEGVIFYVLQFKTNLKRTLESEGYEKRGKTYYANDRTGKDVKLTETKGINWSGFYHKNICGISCRETGFHASGECEFYYFSNGIRTISLMTNGLALEQNIKNEILRTFHFDE